MILERNENLAEFVGIFLVAGSLEENLLAISIDKDRYEYVDHVVDLVKLMFDIEPAVTGYCGGVLISISDREVIEAFKRDALEM